jgi:hypothetical protein
MKQNMGTADRIIRTILSALIVVLYYLDIIGGVWGIVLLVIGVISLTTSLIGFCPSYFLFGINSCKTNKKSTIRA